MTKKVPMRRCIGCMESKPKSELIRIACYEGRVSPDPSGKAKGRGVYVCPSAGCIRRLRKKNALSRSFGVQLSEEETERIFEELSRYER